MIKQQLKKALIDIMDLISTSPFREYFSKSTAYKHAIDILLDKHTLDKHTIDILMEEKFGKQIDQNENQTNS